MGFFCISYSTEHCVLSLCDEDWEVLLDTVLKAQSMICHFYSNILTTSSKVFYLRDVQLHSILFNERKKLRNYVHRSCPLNLSTKAFFSLADH